MQFHKKYNLWSKDAPVESQQTNPIKKPLVDTPSKIQPRSDSAIKDLTEKAKSKEDVPKKALKIVQQASGKEVEKTCPPFNFEHEMAIDIEVGSSKSMNLLERGKYLREVQNLGLTCFERIVCVEYSSAQRF
jgi:hypothetical protein